MKRADVVFAGLVIVGVFGLVFAGQVVSSAKFSPQNGEMGMVSVGQSCPTDKTIDTYSGFCSSVAASHCNQATSYITIGGELYDQGGCSSTTKDSGCSLETGVAPGATERYSVGGRLKSISKGVLCAKRTVYTCKTETEQKTAANGDHYFYSTCGEKSSGESVNCGDDPYSKPNNC